MWPNIRQHNHPQHNTADQNNCTSTKQDPNTNIKSQLLEDNANE